LDWGAATGAAAPKLKTPAAVFCGAAEKLKPVLEAAGVAAGAAEAPNEKTPACCGAAAAGAAPKAGAAAGIAPKAEDAAGAGDPKVGATVDAPKAGAAAVAAFPPKLKDGLAGVDAAPN